MRSKTRPPKKKYNQFEWHQIFVWRPRRIVFCEPLVPETHHPPYLWVWLEHIERKWNSSQGPDWHYRLINQSTLEGETTGK